MNCIKKGKDDKATFFHPDLLEIPPDRPPYLKGYRCKECGKIWFPKFLPCPNPDCWSDNMEVVPLSRRGKLYSATDIYVGQPSMRGYIPLTVGYVDLLEGVRIFSQLEGELGSFQCGDQVELTTGSVRNDSGGQPILGYKFKKVSY